MWLEKRNPLTNWYVPAEGKHTICGHHKVLTPTSTDDLPLNPRCVPIWERWLMDVTERQWMQWEPCKSAFWEAKHSCFKAPFTCKTYHVKERSHVRLKLMSQKIDFFVPVPIWERTVERIWWKYWFTVHSQMGTLPFRMTKSEMSKEATLGHLFICKTQLIFII